MKNIPETNTPVLISLLLLSTSVLVAQDTNALTGSQINIAPKINTAVEAMSLYYLVIYH